jgi:multiple sugar transport system substrate-binding protein
MSGEKRYLLTRRGMVKTMVFTAVGAVLASCRSAISTLSAATTAPTSAGATAAPAVPTSAGAIAAPTVVSAKPTTLKMLTHASGFSDQFRHTAVTFQQQTGVGLDITEVPFNDLQPKMMMELLAGSGKYDIYPITNAMLYAAAPYLVDMTPLFTSDLLADLGPATVEHCRDLDEVLRAVPFYTSLPANFYRTDLLKARGLTPPTTWDEYVEVCKAVTIEASGNQPKIWGSLIEATSSAIQPAVILVGWFYQNGGAIADAQRKPTINLPENVEALQFVVDLVNKYKVAPPEAAEMSYSDVHTMFMEGRGATAINWQYMVALANTSDQSVVKNLFSVVPVPAGKKKGVNTDDWVFAVPTNSMAIDYAKQFAMLELGKDAQLDMIKTNGLGTRVSMMNPNDPEVLAANPFIGAWIEEMKWATPQPKWKNLNEDWMPLSVALNNAVTLKATPKDALDEAQTEISALVAKG